jgi:purine-nucleoside phosphorylase
MLEEIKGATAFLKARIQDRPDIGIILGTGLGDIVNEIEVYNTIPYREIPNFPLSTVEGHSGNLIFGLFQGRNVVVLQGRFHLYEGYTMKDITFPVRVMKQLGIKLLVVSNACGGLNPDFQVGDIMVIEDHINLMWDNPLIGKNEKELGHRFPDMSEPYDLDLIDAALKIAKRRNIRCHKGVYAGVAGPTYETRAEYKFLSFIGADAVGMSTVPEVIAARHMNLPCLAFSVISDLGVEGKIEKITHKKVILEAQKVEPSLATIIRELFEGSLNHIIQ